MKVCCGGAHIVIVFTFDASVGWPPVPFVCGLVEDVVVQRDDSGGAR